MLAEIIWNENVAALIQMYCTLCAKVLSMQFPLQKVFYIILIYKNHSLKEYDYIVLKSRDSDYGLQWEKQPIG